MPCVVPSGRKFRSVVHLSVDGDKKRLYGPHRETRELAELDSQSIDHFRSRIAGDLQYFAKLGQFIDEMRVNAGFRPSGSGVRGPPPSKRSRASPGTGLSAAGPGRPGRSRKTLEGPHLSSLLALSALVALPRPPQSVTEVQTQQLLMEMAERLNRCADRKFLVAEVQRETKQFPISASTEALAPLNLTFTLQSVRSLLVRLGQSLECLRDGASHAEHMAAFNAAIHTYINLIDGSVSMSSASSSVR